MRRIDQCTSSDCFRCCVAMVLDLPYEEVPDFVGEHLFRLHTEPGVEEDDWLKALDIWAASRGRDVLRIASTSDGELLHDPGIRGVPWIASGPTERGTNHAVVYAGAAPHHDPHSSRAGLVAITAATVFVRGSGEG